MRADIVLIVLIGACAAVGAWLLLGRLLRLWRDYDHRLQDETRRTLDASFLFVDAAQLRPLWWMAGALILLVAAWLAGRWWGIAPVLLGLAMAPPLVLRQMRQRRLRQFDEQLPEFMQALAGALRAGAGLQPALQNIVPQSLPPLSQEFSLMLREQRLGLAFQDALQQLHQRMPTESCSLVVSALGIAAQTGGGLADTLERIAQTLRSRQHWLGRVRALTAQGRMQSHIMAALPVCLLLVLSRLEPEAMSLLYRTWYGGLVLAIMGVLEVLGIVWIRRVAAIDV
ncbi:type II secretion system F family protein [Castellaniella sp.]|uniref:type II secretion system F family protein n=1 Tax=Castellaniella sp. TaxID=1955812 RepID=UPI002AFDD86B|nr:type II secretion system F family protein [Castellaniella sp.]